MESPKAEWRRPCDIMKLHRRKKRSDSGKAVEFRRDVLCSKSPLHDSTNTRLNGPAKRRNPFSCHPDSPLFKKHNSIENGIATHNKDPPVIIDRKPDTENQDPRLLLQILDVADQVTEKESTLEAKLHINEQCIKLKQSIESLSSPKPEPSPHSVAVSQGPKWESGAELPMDWSLKQKARFMSPNSFSWCAMLKSMEEAQGMNAFITREQQPESVADSSNQCSGKEFQRCIMHWIHPNLPWIRLFPRINNDNKVSKPSLPTTDDEVVNALRTDWAESFTSAFYLVRAKYCPYFYLCAHQFTVMFRAAGVQGETITAVVTPTTRGFREALVKEGINFMLPLLEKQNDTSELDSEPTIPLDSKKLSETAADDDDETENDAAASVWLESIGLNKANFPELDPAKVKIQREGYKVIDNRPESLVRVEGGNVHALFNFLLNWRSCVASSGAQTGIPPTILSPVGFRGATLQSLKVKQASAKQQDSDGTIRQVNVLELMGPILPHNIQSLSQLFTTTQAGEFSTTLNTHDPTTPINAGMHDKNVTKVKLSPGSDMNENLVKQTSIERGTIKELEYTNEQYHWTVC